MESRAYFLAPLLMLALLAGGSVVAADKVANTNTRHYGSKWFSAPLSKSQAKTLILEYYNNHSLWSRTYKMTAVKRIRLERRGDKRVLAHVEYSYEPVEKNKSFSKGVDKRVFLFIRKSAWAVISMGQHKSARF